MRLGRAENVIIIILSTLTSLRFTLSQASQTRTPFYIAVQQYRVAVPTCHFTVIAEVHGQEAKIFPKGEGLHHKHFGSRILGDNQGVGAHWLLVAWRISWKQPRKVQL